MLQRLNEGIQGIVAWTIIILIAITFMMFGVDYYFQSHSASKSKVDVNGETITEQQYDLEYRRLKQQQDTATLTSVREKQLKEQALQQLVMNNVTLQAAKKAGFYVGQEQAKQAILQIPQFQEDGQFSAAKYQQALHSALYTPESFIEQVEQGMLINQQRFAFVASAFTLNQEVQQFIKLYFQKRSFDYIRINAKDFDDKIKISKEQINKFYNDNKSLFVTPEKVSLQFIKLSMKEVAANVDVSDEEVKTYYEENVALFRTPARWKVAHILFSTKGKNKEKTLKQAKKVATELQNNPEKFKEFVKRYSDDKLSALKGGELAWITAGTSNMDKELVKLKKPGQISSVFSTPYGYEVVKLLEIKPSKTKPFSEVKDTIKKQLVADKAQRDFSKRSETLTDLSYQSPDSLKAVADELKLPIQETELFSRNGGSQGIANNKTIIAAAFSQEVLDHANNSEPLQLDNDSLVVIRILKHQKPQPTPLSEVEAQIKQRLLLQKAQALAAEKGNKVLALAIDGKLTTKDLKKLGLKWSSVTDVKRDDTANDAELIKLGFALPHPTAQNKTPTNGHSLTNGDFLIVRLKALTPGTDKEVSKEHKQAIKHQLETNYGLMDYEYFMSGLMKKAKIERHV